MLASISTPATWLALPATIFAMAPFQAATSAPQTFNTALPVAKGNFVFREQLVYSERSGDRSLAGREMTVAGAVSVLGFGVTARLAVFGAVPYLDKQADVPLSGSDERGSRQASGIGDLRLLGRYTVVQDDAPGRTFRVAPFFGLQLPSGEDDDRNGVGRLPAALQAGSGARDMFAGLVVTRQTLAYQVDAQLSYEDNAEANGFEFGDELRLDVSAQFRLWPRELGEDLPGFLYGVIEANFLKQDAHTERSLEDRNSGGRTWWVSPGIQYVTRRWIVEGIVQVPVSQNLNGTALEEDFTVRAGFRFNF